MVTKGAYSATISSSQPSDSTPHSVPPGTSPEAAAAKPVKPGEPPGKSDKDKKPGEKPDKEKKPGKKPDADEGPKPITRPTKPPVPPNPDELKIRPDASGRLSKFQFNGQTWQPVLEWLADISKKSLDWQELPGDYLNLTTQRSYKVHEVRDLINRHLLARGFTLLCDGEVMTVMNLKKLNPGLVPRVATEDLKRHDPHEFVKVLFPLDWMTAENAVEELEPLRSPHGRLTALKSTNRLEAIDAVVNLRQIAEILRQEQSPDSQQRLVREFTLQYARAEEVYQQLKTLLGIEKPAATPMTPQGTPGMSPEMMRQQQQAMMAQSQGKGKQPPGASSKPKVDVFLVVNPRKNSLVAVAPPDKMAMIAQAVATLDVPADASSSLLTNVNRMQVYRLTGVDPEPVVKTLQEIGSLEPTTRIQIDKKNKAIIAYASLADHLMIRTVVEKLSGSERQFEVIRLRRLAADYVAGTIMFMMGKEKKKEPTRRRYPWNPPSQRDESAERPDAFRVEANIEDNQLLLWANDVELAEVVNLLRKLGEIPPQDRRGATIRILETGGAENAKELLERIRCAWPSLSPNPLELPPLPPPKPAPEASAPEEPSTESGEKSAAAGPSGRPWPPKHRIVPISQRIEEEPRAADRSSTSPAAPPVKVELSPDGRITITSDDPQALNLFEDLAEQLATPKSEYKIFRLKYAWAYGVALNLEDFFKEEENKSSRYVPPWIYYEYGLDQEEKEPARLSRRRPLKFISDSDTNSILVQGADAKQLQTITELIQEYDKPPDTDDQLVRKTEVIPLKYSKAKVIADAVKEVYRDLLSEKDKAFQDARQRRRDSDRSFVIFRNESGNASSEQKMPKYKGVLSIGVDELSNTLIVSAPAFFLDDVCKLAHDLDEAAAPTSVVEVVKIGRGIRGPQMQQTLAEILGQGKTRGATSSRATPSSERRNSERQRRERERNRNR